MEGRPDFLEDALSLFWPDSHQKRADRQEVERIRAKYGEDAKEIVQARAQDPALSDRDRKHWRRIARQI